MSKAVTGSTLFQGVCVRAHVCSVVSDFGTLWILAHQAPLSMGL